MERWHWGLDKRNLVRTILASFLFETAAWPLHLNNAMALKIRLSRIGTKNQPHFRVVVAEARSRRDGAPVEQLGAYNPRAKGDPLTVKLDRIDYWLSKGAQPTDTVRTLLKRTRKAAAVRAEKDKAETAPAAAPVPPA
jgi:small subunit ribosomal protein S16